MLSTSKSWHSRSPRLSPHATISQCRLFISCDNTLTPIVPAMLSSRATRPLCSACESSSRSLNHQQVRHATLLRRPKRPYTFTQLVTLSDGSTFLHRTTSPAPIYRSAKDTKNNAMWNPSSQKLLNVEEDEAGRLRKFRQRFGRGYDAESMSDGGDEVSIYSLSTSVC